MNFSTRQKVLDTIAAGDQVSRIRSENRANVNKSANGAPPLTDAEAKRLKIKINVEWGELARLLQQARRQYEEAILSPSNYFRVRIHKAPEDKRTLWEETISCYLNRPMKRSDDYTSVKEDQILSLVAHGIGPQAWHSKESWCPETVAIEDLRVATDTQVSLKNLEWFALRWQPTSGELARKVFGPDAVEHWKKPAIQQILRYMEELNYATYDYNWIDHPEKMWELYKQNLGYYLSDAAPTIALWNFYFRNTDDPGKSFWKKVVVPDVNLGTTASLAGDEFLYDAGDEACAQNLSELLHIQFGDLNNKSPRLYHSVRSLGFKLLEPCYWMNIARCRGLQHFMENCNVWFRVQDPAGRARAQKIELFDKAIIEEGVSIVPQNERHQINDRFMESIMAQLRQLMAEESTAYTQQIDTGTQKEQTYGEALIKAQRSNAEMASLLSRWFRKEVSAYREICRRFCLSNSSDPDVIEFHKECKAAGIPRQWLNVELWDIEPEVPMGAGHPAMRVSEAQLLLAIRAMLDPTAQQESLHMYVEAVTNNPKVAERLAPLGKLRGLTTGAEWAVTIFPSLMEAVPVPKKEGVSQIDLIQTLIGMMAAKVILLKQPGFASVPAFAGLAYANQYTSELIQKLAEDANQKEVAATLGDELANLMNEIKAAAQQFAESQQQQQDGNGKADPADLAKAQAIIFQAQTKAKAKGISDAQKLTHKDVASTADERRKDTVQVSDERRKDAAAFAEMERARIKVENETQAGEGTRD